MLKKSLSFPSSHTILLIIAGIIAILTWCIPSGKFEQLSYQTLHNEGYFIHEKNNTTVQYRASQDLLDSLGIQIALSKFENGDIRKPIGIPGTFQYIDSQPQGITAFIQSPIKGISDSMDVILFVLIIGGFIGIINRSGAFDAGIQVLARSMKGHEKWLIIIICTLIALGGTTFGLAEETIAFYPILVPVFLATRYDAMVALATIYIGSAMGTMASTVNPFSAIIASDAAGINWTSGLYGRLIMLLIGLVICLWYIIRYAEKVKNDPSKSIIFEQKDEIDNLFKKDETKEIAFTGRTSLILIIFLASFIVMIYGVSSLDWWFLEMTTLFFVSSILIGFIAKFSEKVFVAEFVNGAKDLLNVALIIGLARGVSVIMEDGQISDTLLFYSSNIVENLSAGVFANVMLFIFAGLSFFIPSSSGMAVLSMPIMAPLADVVGAPREIVVDAYQYGMGLMAFITPTGLILASLTMVNVTYNKWLRFVGPLLLFLTIYTCVHLVISLNFL